MIRLTIKPYLQRKHLLVADTPSGAARFGCFKLQTHRRPSVVVSVPVVDTPDNNNATPAWTYPH